MTEFIEFLNTNQDIIRPIWFGLGFIGLCIMKSYTRSSFYENHNPFWWIWVLLFYACVGPMIFVVSIITLFNPKQRR